MTTILSVSLPADLKAKLDAEAKRLRRSRSFVVGEAIQEYVTRRERAAFTLARERTLREGLSLSPTERVKLAEELWQDFARGHHPRKPWTIAFDTFDQYETWRRQGGGGPAG